MRVSADRARVWQQAAVGVLLVASWVGLAARPTFGQQFNGDNQWVAPHGVGTFVTTVGQEYSTVLAVAALLPDTEFNIGVTRFVDKPLEPTEDHYSGIFYDKRLVENEAGNAGWAVSVGTGVDPSHLEAGTFTDSFRSWFANTSYTVAFRGGDVTWDMMPGVMVNLDEDQSGETAWGMTWGSRAAIYKIIPQSALVGEVFGTTGEAYAEPSYRVGVRWESPRVVVADTQAREAQVTAARSAAGLSRARYDGGVTSYLEVLDSDRSLFRAELLASSTRRQQVVAVVSLYKALGGGWPTEEEISTAGGFLPANLPPSGSTMAPSAGTSNNN